MPPSKSNESIESLGQNLELITDLAQSLISELKSFSSNHENLKSQFESVASDVEKLSSIIRDGNGKPSLLTTIALVEKDLINLKKELDRLEKNTDESLDKIQRELDLYRNIKTSVDEISKWKEELNKDSAENIKGKWQLKVAMLGGGLGVVTAVINIILQLLIKK